MPASFFAVVALLLAGIGLYGVLNYSLPQRRELGIRIAIGAPAREIVRRATVDGLSIVIAGAVGGVGPGMASARYIEALLYQVRATEPAVMFLPALVLLAAAPLASMPAALLAMRIDPEEMLRAE